MTTERSEDRVANAGWTRAPFDPELQVFLDQNPLLSRSLQPHHIAKLRELQAAPGARLPDAVLERGGSVAIEEFGIPASDPAQALSLLLLRPTRHPGPRPGMCFFHGGGMVMGDNRTGIEALLDWVDELGIAIASVGYRLAPEHPYPVPVEDCYATLRWLDAHRQRVGFDAQPLFIAGTSAGGGLAAAVALLARDRNGPAISDQILMCPMLDDAARFPSSVELDGEGVWDRHSNRTGWNALLGDARGAPHLPASAAPTRERRLVRLPAAFLDVGAVETFRDEVIDYGARLAQAGVPVEMHVWSGAFHGFDVLAPDAAVARAARAARLDYLRRRLRCREAG